MRALIYLKYYGQRISLAVAGISFVFGLGFGNNTLLLVAIFSTLLCVAFFKF